MLFFFGRRYFGRFPSAANLQTCQTPGELPIEFKRLQQTRYGEPLPAFVAADPSRREQKIR